MFDYVLVKNLKLPEFNGNLEKIRFQSRDTECQCMSDYLIDGDQLFLKHINGYWEDGQSIRGCFRFGEFIETDSWWEPNYFTGSFKFHTNLDRDYKRWIEFLAIFEDGRLVEEIKCIKNDKDILDEIYDLTIVEQSIPEIEDYARQLNKIRKIIEDAKHS